MLVKTLNSTWVNVIKLEDFINKNATIAVLGLGYVGLPLAVGLAKYFKVLGFDINKPRVDQLKAGVDHTGEIEKAAILESSIEFSSDPQCLKNAAVIIIAVPTPIDEHLRPNLGPVEAASRTVGQNLKPGAVVVYESTVYPGVTEDICVPILEAESGLRLGTDFSVGYSPERINPGDKVHTVETIVKVVAASNPQALELLAGIYGALVKAGIHKASSIKVAEAAKVIENTQRDINIALMNELALIFDRIGIDTLEVLEAAGTKWNFIGFKPGLVGGHCIGVDPYYLTFKAQELGYQPEVILAGRRINDNMGKYVAEVCIKQMVHNNCLIKNAKVGILGLTFKENVCDLRNTRVVDIMRELGEYGVECLVHDPMASPAEALKEYGITLKNFNEMKSLDALILAVPHDSYKSLAPEDLHQFFAPECNQTGSSPNGSSPNGHSPNGSSPNGYSFAECSPLVLDLKGFWPVKQMQEAGIKLWRL